MFRKNKKLKTLVNEFNTITGERIETDKVGKNKSKAYAPNGYERTRAQMMKILTEQHTTMASQATEGI